VISPTKYLDIGEYASADGRRGLFDEDVYFGSDEEIFA